MSPRYRQPTKRNNDLGSIFAQTPWWAPIGVVAVVCLGIVVASWKGNWGWPLTKIWLELAVLIIGLYGVVGQVEKIRLRNLLATTQSLDALRAMPWTAFEELVLASYRHKGYSGELTRRGADGGVDVILEKARIKTFVQCKHWKAQKVGVDKVRELKGSMAAENVEHGILVTSGRFTLEAKRFSAISGITLIDGPALLDLVAEARGDIHSTSRALPTGRVSSASTTSVTEAPQPCPRCGSAMVMRSSARGPFWGCSTFPKCRGTRQAVSSK